MTASCLTEDGGMWGSWLLTDPSAECLNSLVHLWTRQLLCLSLCQSEFGHVELLKYLTRRASKACQWRYPFSNRCYERRTVSICTSLHTSVEPCVGPFQLRGTVCVIKPCPPPFATNQSVPFPRRSLSQSGTGCLQCGLFRHCGGGCEGSERVNARSMYVNKSI